MTPHKNQSAKLFVEPERNAKFQVTRWRCIQRSFSMCYIWLRSWVGSLVRVLIPAAVLADGRATTQVCDPWFLVTAVWEAGFRQLVSILWEDYQTTVWPSSLTGTAGDEAPIIVLWGVGHAEVIAVGPCCGALIKDGPFLGDAPASFLLLQLSYSLRRQICTIRAKTLFLLI